MKVVITALVAVIIGYVVGTLRENYMWYREISEAEIVD